MLMLPSTKRWLLATSACCSAWSSLQQHSPAARPYLSQAGLFSARGTSPSSAAAAFAGAGHCSSFQPKPSSKHTWAGQIRGAPCSKASNKAGLHRRGSSSCTWQTAPCPSSSTSSWQDPAPGVPWGKRGSFTGACLSRPNRPVLPV